MNRWPALVLCSVLAVSASPIQADTKLPVDPTLLPNKITLQSGDGTMISGYLYRPPTQGARPAVLMMHGCSGLLTKKYGRLKSRETAWRDIFLAEGYVVLLLDSFTERGHRSVCKISLSYRPIESNRERPHDAYGALHWLQSQPFVAPDKVVLGGWSNGAMSMLWTVFAGAPQRPKILPHDFRAAFGFYPGCITLRKRKPRYTAAVPTLLQLGAYDNWTLPEPCRELVEAANATGGAKMTAESYQGAVHSFDHPTSKRRTISVSNGRRVRIGSDPVARRKAIERVRLFLRNVFTT